MLNNTFVVVCFLEKAASSKQTMVGYGYRVRRVCKARCIVYIPVFKYGHQHDRLRKFSFYVMEMIDTYDVCLPRQEETCQQTNTNHIGRFLGCSHVNEICLFKKKEKN